MSVPKLNVRGTRENCLWSRADDESDLWETTCGQAFEFNDGGPKENHFKFCYYCGRPLRAVKS